MGKAEQLYNDLVDGNYIPTNDLIFLKDHFDSVATWCWQLGPVFKLPAVEASQRGAQIDGYLRERQRLD